MIPALIIIILLSFFVLWFRAFAGFNLIIIGFSMIVAVGLGGDKFFLELGIPMLAAGLLINFLTSLGIERSARLRYMRHLFLYGMFIFLKITMICTLILIPFFSFMAKLSHSYREMVIVDSLGRSTGKRVTIDTDTYEDSEGNQYSSANDLF